MTSRLIGRRPYKWEDLMGCQARVNPDGYVAQRFEADFNGSGHWLLMHMIDGNLTATVLTDADVESWTRLVEGVRDDIPTQVNP